MYTLFTSSLEGKCTAPEETKDGDMLTIMVFFHNFVFSESRNAAQTNKQSTASKSLEYFSMQ